MAAYVYILECSDGSYYTGSTKNIEFRLWQHEKGQGANDTRKHLPVKLVFVESFEKVDSKQNASLKWLVSELSIHLNLQDGDVYRHPTVSYKQPTEASTASW
jgi:predicted GIY-YIG superfamily endonuclease